MVQGILFLSMCVIVGFGQCATAPASADASSESNPIVDYIKVLEKQIAEVTKEVADKQKAIAGLKAGSPELATATTELKKIQDRLDEMVARKSAQQYTADKMLPFVDALADAQEAAAVADALLEDDDASDDDGKDDASDADDAKKDAGADL